MGPATLVKISSTTGRVEALTTLDTARGETAHYWPQFLPDGRHIAVQIRSTNPKHQGVFITALDAPQERRPLLAELTTAPVRERPRPVRARECFVQPAV